MRYVKKIEAQTQKWFSYEKKKRVCKLYSLEIRANENIEKDEDITDQTIADDDIKSSYERNQ